MADKTITTTYGVSEPVVTTAGSIAVDIVNIAFNDDDDLTTIISQIEDAERVLHDYFGDKS